MRADLRAVSNGVKTQKGKAAQRSGRDEVRPKNVARDAVSSLDFLAKRLRLRRSSQPKKLPQVEHENARELAPAFSRRRVEIVGMALESEVKISI